MTTTSYLELEDQATGANNNTWGDIADTNMAYLELAIARVLGISTTGGTTVLTSAQNRYPIIAVTGALVSNATIEVKTQEKNWHIINNTTGNFTLTVKTSAGTGYVVPRRRALKLYCDGTNVNLVRGPAIPQVTAGGTADVMTGTVAPAIVSADLVDDFIVLVDPVGANTVTTPTINLNGLGAKTITKGNGAALAAGDIAGTNHRILLNYRSSAGVFQLLNPATGSAALKDIGTSGGNVPVLNAANTWSLSQTFTAGFSAGAGSDITGVFTIQGDNTGGAGTATNRINFLDLDTTTALDQPIGEIRWNISDADAASALQARFLVNSASATGGAYFAWYVSTSGGAASEKMRLDGTGNLRLLTTGGAIGYMTGAGNTVTQATSRTTGVTINRPTGGITLFTAAGSATAATFTVTNSVVENNDTILLNQNGGTNKYVFLVSNVTNGSFDVTFYTTGGVASDAPRINFTIIKGAAT